MPGESVTGFLHPGWEDMAVQVLDHGYVRLVERWGSDERIVESARMSTGKGFRGWGPIKCDCVGGNIHGADVNCTKCGGHGSAAGDEGFLKFLYENKHMSPFEQAGMTVEVQAPIFVFREWHRHRTQSYNEMSARYIRLPDLFYVPSLARLQKARQSTVNKQTGDMVMDEMKAMQAQELIDNQLQDARRVYEELLELGVAREVARVVVPVSQYSRMRASANLRNWLGFLALRLPTTAQWEIRQYAIVVGKLVERYFPRVWELFVHDPSIVLTLQEKSSTV